jgi:hypothetical protein
MTTNESICRTMWNRMKQSCSWPGAGHEASVIKRLEIDCSGASDSRCCWDYTRKPSIVLVTVFTHIRILAFRENRSNAASTLLDLQF